MLTTLYLLFVVGTWIRLLVTDEGLDGEVGQGDHPTLVKYYTKVEANM